MNSTQELPVFRVTNTLTGKKEELRPLEPGHIKMYACGVTVYDKCHLGHAMQAILYDTFVRYMRHRGYQVTYVRNYTDVDDKIINRANELGINPMDLSAQMIEACDRDLLSVGVHPADHQPKVSAYIDKIILYIQQLIEKGAAYATEQGDVYYSVRQKADYGKLSNQKVSQLESGHRVASHSNKQDELDFALWKAEEAQGANWDSPWGKGRPGWHIECSVMATDLLGDEFDIHGGGRDLVFPHHENEIAQSESHSGTCYARYWIHSGLMTINHQKMSKSDGNFLTIEDALLRLDPEVIRYNIFQVHYTSNVDFSQSSFAQAYKKVFYYYKTLQRAQVFLSQSSSESQELVEDFDFATYTESFYSAMDDDFNLPRAMVAFNELFQGLNNLLDLKGMKNRRKVGSVKQGLEEAQKFSQILGIGNQEPDAFLDKLKKKYFDLSSTSLEKVQGLLEQRRSARENKDYALSDSLREELSELGIQVNDGTQGQSWDLNDKALEVFYSN